MMIRDLGQIRELELPGEWTERAIAAQPLQSKQVRSFHSVENQNVQLRFIYRGHVESEETGRRFQDCLSAAPHKLDRTEINSLEPVLGEVAETGAFEVSVAQTMEIRKRRVLWIEGRWLDSPHWAGSVFVDADGSGRVIEQLECFAELSAYETAAQAFAQMLRTICWK